LALAHRITDANAALFDPSHQFRGCIPGILEILRRQGLLAGRWCQRRGLYRSYYEAMLARNGGLKTKAVCAIARKLVPLLLAVLQRGEPFDRARWDATRHQPVLTH